MTRTARLFLCTLVLALAALATGCAGVRDAYTDLKDRQELGYIEAAKKSCERFGFRPNTDSSAQCVSTNLNVARDRDAFQQAAFMADKK